MSKKAAPKTDKVVGLKRSREEDVEEKKVPAKVPVPKQTPNVTKAPQQPAAKVIAAPSKAATKPAPKEVTKPQTKPAPAAEQNKAGKGKASKKEEKEEEEEEEVSDFGGDDDENDGDDAEDFDMEAFFNGEEDEDMEMMEDEDEDEDMDMMEFGDEDGNADENADGALEGDDEDGDDDDENADVDELLSFQATSKPKAGKSGAAAAGGKKKGAKGAAVKGAEASNDVDDDDDDDDNEDGGVIQANFDFFDPDPARDYHAVKAFVRSLTEDKDFDAGNLADIVACQAEVGTVVKSDDAGDEPLGFITILDYSEHKDSASFKQIKEYILSNAGKHKAQFESLFANAGKPSQRLGLLLQDRVVNLPVEVVPALYSELLKDIDWAREEEKADKTNKWAFQNVLIISKCCEVSSGKVSGESKRRRVDDSGAGSAELWYPKFEDELIRAAATTVRQFPGQAKITWPEVGRVPVTVQVMVVPYKAFVNFSKNLSESFGATDSA